MVPSILKDLERSEEQSCTIFLSRADLSQALPLISLGSIACLVWPVDVSIALLLGCKQVAPQAG